MFLWGDNYRCKNEPLSFNPRDSDVATNETACPSVFVMPCRRGEKRVVFSHSPLASVVVARGGGGGGRQEAGRDI